MAIYVRGQTLTLSFAIRMKVLRAFAYDGIIYYIMLIEKESAIRGKNGSLSYAVLRNDDTQGNIPEEVNTFADTLVQTENLLEGLD